MERKKSIFTFFIVVLPIISVYASPFRGINIAEFILLCTVFAFFFINIKTIDFRQILGSSYFILLICIIITTCLSSFFQTHFATFDVVERILRFAFYVAAVLLLKDYFDINAAFRWLCFFAAAASIYLIAQIVSYYTLHIVLPWYVEWLPVAPGDAYTSIDFDTHFRKLYRPSSFFLEPGHFAHYILPAFVYTLFSDRIKLKKRVLLSVLYMFSLILSTSGQAILIAFGILTFWWVRRLVTSLKHNQLFLTVFIAVIIAVVTPYILNNEIFKASIDRLFDSPGASANSRIYRGFVVYGMLDDIYKIIGVGFGNISYHVNAYNIYTQYDIAKNYDYMNSFCYLLVTGGILSCFMYLAAFFDWIRNTNSFYRIIVAVFFAVSFVGTAFISPIAVFYLFFIYSNYSKKALGRMKYGGRYG